jgi:hypothetical protein
MQRTLKISIHGRRKNREIDEKIMEKDEEVKKKVFVRNR